MSKRKSDNELLEEEKKEPMGQPVAAPAVEEPELPVGHPTKIYTGSLRRPKNKAYWLLSMHKKGEKARTFTFADSTYGGSSDAAFAQGRLEQIRQSDLLGLTTDVHPCFTTGFTTQHKQQVGSLMDGDGHIMVRKEGIVLVGFTQSHASNVTPPALIQWLVNFYGGCCNCEERAEDSDPKNVRHAWRWVIQNKNAQVLLRHMRDHGTLKRDQASWTYDLVCRMKFGKARHKIPMAERLALRVKLHEAKKHYADVIIPDERLTIPYISSLFDAEGCITMEEGGPRISITQTSCPALLHALVRVLKGGAVGKDKRQYRLNGVEAVLAFCTAILPFSIGKAPQIRAVLDAIDILPKPGYQPPLPPEVHHKRRKLQQQLSALKKDRTISDDELDANTTAQRMLPKARHTVESAP